MQGTFRRLLGEDVGKKELNNYLVHKFKAIMIRVSNTSILIILEAYISQALLEVFYVQRLI